jgi:hypothetical protein
MEAREVSWTYDLAVEAGPRMPGLVSRIGFSEITERIVTDMTVQCCHRSEIRGTDFVRPVYTVLVGSDLFDLFFNSMNSYRAAYFQSPGAGLDANVSFMRAIVPRLVQDPLSANSTLAPAFIQDSLVTPSAKAWLAESGKEIDAKCDGCKGEWSSGSVGQSRRAEILTGRWERALGQKAEWGRKAPFLTKLRLMGAFINERRHELVPYDKRFRAYEIHEYGWS